MNLNFRSAKKLNMAGLVIVGSSDVGLVLTLF